MRWGGEESKGAELGTGGGQMRADRGRKVEGGIKALSGGGGRHRKRKPSGGVGVGGSHGWGKRLQRATRRKAERKRLRQTGTKKLYLTVATCTHSCKRDRRNIAISLKPCKQLNPRVSATRAV